MKFSMVSIGNELLDGRTADTNAQFVGNLLSSFGARLDEIFVVPDVVETIVTTIDRARGDIVILSGGLGPTVDDLTREAVAKWAKVDLAQDDAALERIRTRFESRGFVLTPNNFKQAQFPVGSVVIPNEGGTAPAFETRSGEKRIYAFPGVPREFRALFSDTLTKLMHQTGPAIETRRWQFHGIGESKLEHNIDGIEQFDVVVGFRAHYPTIELKVSSASSQELDRAEAFIFEKVGRYFACLGDGTVAGELGLLLKDRGLTITTAESCTAGGIAAALTDASGSSAWFERGFVTYSNQAKNEMLGVRAATLEKFGAVSPQVACQMAFGARRNANADLAVAVTGIAGPGGGSPEKPVGTVHFGLATPEGVFHQLIPFRIGGRDRIRSGTVVTALMFARWYLNGELEDRSRVSGPYSETEVDRDLGVEVAK